LLVDDSSLVRQGLRAVLETHGKADNIQVIGEASGIGQARAALVSLQPDVLLLDIRLPDGSGLDYCRELKATHPNVRVLILTSESTDSLIYKAVLAGAQGYLVKEIDPEGLVKAIIDAADGKSVLPSDIAGTVMQMLRDKAVRADPLESLSPQEVRVVSLIAEGLTNKEIGDRLNLSDNTVKNYLVNAFEKLGVKRRSQAVAAFLASKRTLSELPARPK
jgi:two-component system, NarL family, response regulator DevR